MNDRIPDVAVAYMESFRDSKFRSSYNYKQNNKPLEFSSRIRSDIINNQF